MTGGNDDFLPMQIVMRGGTLLHKVCLAPPCRYSEDIDLVVFGEGHEDHIRKAPRRVLRDVLGTPKTSVRGALSLAIRNTVKPSCRFGRYRILCRILLRGVIQLERMRRLQSLNMFMKWSNAQSVHGLGLVAVAVSLAFAAGSAIGQTSVSLPQYHIYAGNTHSHTSNTWSHGEQFDKAAPEPGDGKRKAKTSKVLKPDWQKHQGPPSAHYALAKSKGYDFYITDDHSQEAAFQPLSPANPAWVAAKRDAARATDGNFVAIAGYEHSENNGPNGTGHLNVINSSEYLNALAPGIDLRYLYTWLAAVPPNGEGPVVASFNHPGPRGYENWAYRDPKVTDILTLLEVINSNNKIHYEAFVNALDKGWKVSPVCGNDNHGFWGIEHHTSRTFVLATARTKVAILDAMKNRRTYASLDGDMQCRYTVNGAIMGSTLNRPDVFKFEISISDPDTDKPEDKITKIDIVKDGGAVVLVCSPTPAHSVTWSPTLNDATNRFFFVRVWNAGGGETKDGNPAKPVAWLAPVWTGR